MLCPLPAASRGWQQLHDRCHQPAACDDACAQRHTPPVIGFNSHQLLLLGYFLLSSMFVVRLIQCLFVVCLADVVYRTRLVEVTPQFTGLSSRQTDTSISFSWSARLSNIKVIRLWLLAIRHHWPVLLALMLVNKASCASHSLGGDTCRRSKVNSPRGLEGVYWWQFCFFIVVYSRVPRDKQSALITLSW